MQKAIKTSIIIRAYNEERHIERLMRGILNQKTPFAFEIIVVDSGSTDNTVSEALRFGAKVIHISRDEFSFGASINRGIEAAQGEYCVFISGHCYPEHEKWLDNLVRPFSDKGVAIVYGKQRGNEITRYSERRIFVKWFPDDSGGLQNSSFCNNANAAIRRNPWFDHRYNESITGLEDIEWAKNAISQGFSVYYAPDAGVIHLHDETFPQVYRRYKREAIAMRSIFPHETFTFFDFIKLFTLNTLSDYIHSAQDGVFLKNIFEIPAMRFYQFWGTYRGYHYSKPIHGDLRYKFYYPMKPELFKSNKGGRKTAQQHENNH
jgi:rhamnosyltransferase